MDDQRILALMALLVGAAVLALLGPERVPRKIALLAWLGIVLVGTALFVTA